MNPRDLHDAVLNSISLDWKEGSLKLSICPVSVDRHFVQLVASGIRDLQITREFSWGPSNSINECAFLGEESLQRGRVEIQSGDTIEFLCESWKLERVEGQHANA